MLRKAIIENIGNDKSMEFCSNSFPAFVCFSVMFWHFLILGPIKSISIQSCILSDAECLSNFGYTYKSLVISVSTRSPTSISSTESVPSVSDSYVISMLLVPILYHIACGVVQSPKNHKSHHLISWNTRKRLSFKESNWKHDEAGVRVGWRKGKRVSNDDRCQRAGERLEGCDRGEAVVWLYCEKDTAVPGQEWRRVVG